MNASRIPGGSQRVSGGECAICAAVKTIATRAALLAGAQLREEIRRHLVVALTAGLRHDPLIVCGDCHDAIERLNGQADQIARRLGGQT